MVYFHCSTYGFWIYLFLLQYSVESDTAAMSDPTLAVYRSVDKVYQMGVDPLTTHSIEGTPSKSVSGDGIEWQADILVVCRIYVLAIIKENARFMM